jgi:hypothetical protein
LGSTVGQGVGHLGKGIGSLFGGDSNDTQKDK